MIPMEYHVEHVKEKAQALGLDIIEPKPYEVFLDLDSPQDQYVMEALLPILREHGLGLTLQEIRRSRNYNKHAVLVTDGYRALEPMERLLLQACLGSDRKREILSYVALKKGVQYHTVLFGKKPEELVF